ncbi:MAG: SulP family inorganic anion transporter [Hungatella sp.]
MKGYTKEQFLKDSISGALVAVIAFPLSVALAIASGLSPEKGLYTAIVGGFLVSLLGGSNVNIGGATAEELTSDPECLSLKAVPRDTLVYEIEGPIFFATVDELLTITAASSTKVMILRMRGVLTIDITALHRLESLALRCRNAGITLILSHVMEQPYSVMEKANFVECVGIENFCANIDEALERAKQLTGSSR